MKNVVSFFAALLLVFTAFAGDVTIRMDNKNNYDVYIDGRHVSKYSTRNDRIILNNFSNGRHRVDVYRSHDRYKNRDRHDRRYKNRNNRNSQSLGKPVHSASFHVKPQTDVWISIDKKGKTRIEERRRKDRNDRNDRYSRNDRSANSRDDYGYNKGSNYGRNYNNAISSYEFDQLVKKIKSQWFGKLSYAKNALNQNYFYTSQIRQVLEIFSSEKDRLELAQLAYSSTVDPQNYRQLYSLFSYQGQAELDRTHGSSHY